MTAVNRSKIIVLCDLHLCKDGAKPLGVDTTGRFERALDQIARFHPDADLVIVNGDVTDDGQPETYDGFRARMEGCGFNWVATRGNHDLGGPFARIAQPHADTGRYDHLFGFEHGQVCVLDTAVEGEAHGILSQAQLEVLRAALDQGQTLVVMHHPPNVLDLWMDQFRLLEAEPLFETLRAARGNVHVLSGHIHMDSTATCAGFPITTLSGNHFTVNPVLYDVAREDAYRRNFKSGPANYAVVLLKPDTIAVHFETYVEGGTPFSEDRVHQLLTGH